MSENETIADIIAMLRANARGERFDEFSFTSLSDRIEAAWKREREELERYATSKMLDGATIVDNRGNAAVWKETCAKCRDGEIEPDCEYYGEPNGCNSPTYGEHPPVGNAAAIREALMGLIDGMCFHCDLSEDCKGAPCEKMQKAKAALSAPPRQCDVGTAEEQEKRFYEKFCGQSCFGCPLSGLKRSRKADCIMKWAQMPYAEEGGAE